MSGDVLVGVVRKPLGLRGEVFVQPDPDVDEPFTPGRTYHVVEPPPGAPGTLTVATTRLHGGLRVVRFEGVDTRDAAEALRGLVLAVERNEMSLDADVHWSADLLGRDVVDDDGALVGVVEATRDGAAHDYLVVARPDGGELLLPAVAELVEITQEGIVVHAIPGLLDL